MVWPCLRNGFTSESKREKVSGAPRTCWEDLDLGWNWLRLQPSEMLEVVTDRNVLGT